MNRQGILYPRLNERIRKMELRKSQVAALLSMNPSTLQNKLHGRTGFTLDEAVLLKRLLVYPGSLEDLFARREAPGPATEEKDDESIPS